jgi:hypothetical protein
MTPSLFSLGPVIVMILFSFRAALKSLTHLSQ